MKKLIGISFLTLLAASCSIDERAELPDGRVSDLKIIVTPAEEPNTYLLRSNRTDVICFWDLGNGNTASGVNSVTAAYPFPGDYTVSLKAYGNNGRTNDVSVKLSVTEENLFLLNDPMYELIAGEIGGAGKTWMLDAERVGHLATRNRSDLNVTWNANPGEKKDVDIYDDEVTFILNSERGQGFDYVNNGKSGTHSNEDARKSFYDDPAWGATSSSKASTGDYVITCTPPANMGWSLLKTGEGRYYILFPSTATGHGGYLFYFCGWDTEYEIRAISEDHMQIFMWSYFGTSPSLRHMILRTKETESNNDPIEWVWSKE